MPDKNLIFKILRLAQQEKFAVGQFNISNFETAKAVVQAAQKQQSPVIIGTSEGESKFIGLDQAVALIESFRKKTGLPIFLNLDHGKSLDYIKEASDSGYDAVHFDGSKLSLEENIKIAKETVKYAHQKGILTEGEINFIAGTSEALEKIPEIKKEDLTDPKEALRFITETEVDSLAINIGTFHGMDAFNKNPHINLQRLKEIKNAVGDKAFLVLHGGSGTPEEDIRKAIESGIVKININTELRTAFTNTLKKVLEENPKETTPYKYMPKVIEDIQRVVEEKIQLFGSANKIK